MNESDFQKIEHTLAEQHACYVLITCKKPTKQGKMQVRMRYGGDPMLASYLIDGAKDLMEENDEEEEVCFY